ncbi:hypothetical protein LRS06_23160 [Hymenobacter sp. J193]|uniref:hypothetical protein n=1 Tax=Hymenobacter sp. J193 TaxID=2898429 RepID=UPI002150DCE4|nr:hypothetical protein [Hymenobacter sp. J193]MCR5890536.1 hypothetical protein [Hymenobacter sp. J193]MCR5890631.1 hypothetical protein [Hymenobacter sp. J193]
MLHATTPPDKDDAFVTKLLDKLKVEFEPELVLIRPEPYAKHLNCFPNVEEKVKRDGGRIHYGWAIHKTTILCEAERHAVWEDEQEEFVDITPTEGQAEHTLFVSDNEGFVYTGQDTDNVRINITGNPVVDDFIRVCETLSKIHAYGTRGDDMHMRLPDAALELHHYYDALKNALQGFIYMGGMPKKRCLCQGPDRYKNCHGKSIGPRIKADLRKLKTNLGEADRPA